MYHKFKCQNCGSLYFSIVSEEFDDYACEFCDGTVKFIAMSTEPFTEQTSKVKLSRYDDVMIMYGAAGMTGACKNHSKRRVQIDFDEKGGTIKVKSKKAKKIKAEDENSSVSK